MGEQTSAAPPPFQASLVLAGRGCLVVGGGHVAARKVDRLVECGATVTVVAPRVVDTIRRHPVILELRRYRRGEVARYQLVVAATGVAEVDAAVSADCAEHGIFVNVVDNLALSTLLVPASLRRGPVAVSVSTGGVSPALAVWLRDRVASIFGDEIEAMATLLARARRALKAEGVRTEDADWLLLIEGDGAAPGLSRLLAEGRGGECEAAVESWVGATLAAAGNAPRRLAAQAPD
jgi:siroheme synthase-like protein